MPQLDWSSHEILLQAGYEYDSVRDKYYNRGTPSWDATEKAEAGRRQGAWPSSTVEDFRHQEKEWVQTQWAKIKAMKSTVDSQVLETE